MHDTPLELRIVRDRFPRFSEILNDCASNLCVKTYSGEPLSSVLQKICGKISSMETPCCYTFTNTDSITFSVSEDNIVTATSTGTGSVTQIDAGNGMDFTSITSSGPITMGTPSSITLSSTNLVSPTTHTHTFAPGGLSSQVILGDGSLGTLTTANNGLSLSSSTVQLGQSWGQVGNPAAMIGNREITTGVGNNQFRFTDDTRFASLRIHFGETGNGGGPGIVHLDDQSYSQIGFKYVGMDPGFVRDDVVNTCTPTLATAIGLQYISVASGYSCKNTYEGQIGQFLLGVTGGPFADNCLGIFAQVCAGIKLAAHGSGYIRFSGNVFEGSGEYGRFQTTTGYFGLGTIAPDTRLHIVGFPKFVTGNQGLGKVLTSDANGVGDWQTPASGGVVTGTTTITSGTDTRVLFNDGGVIGEDAGLTFNKTTNILKVANGSNTITSGIDPLIFVDAGTNSYAAEFKGNGAFTGFLVSNTGASNVPFIQMFNVANNKNWTFTLDADNGFNLREGSATGTSRMKFAAGSSTGIGNPTSADVNYTLIIRQPNDGANNRGIKILANNETAALTIGYQKVSYTSQLQLEGLGGIQLLGTGSGVFLNMTSTGSVGIGNNPTPDTSSLLDLQSITQGFLPPRMTATQASAISSPAEGLLLYVTNTNGTFTSKGWWGFSGATWEKLNN